MKLHDLQQELIDLFGQMSEAAVVNTDLLAAPFLSVEPEFYDPHNHKTILYVLEKQQVKTGIFPSFWANPTREARRATTTRFLQELVATGQYRSAFWRFAKN